MSRARGSAPAEVEVSPERSRAGPVGDKGIPQAGKQTRTTATGGGAVRLRRPGSPGRKPHTTHAQRDEELLPLSRRRQRRSYSTAAIPATKDDMLYTMTNQPAQDHEHVDRTKRSGSSSRSGNYKSYRQKPQASGWVRFRQVPSGWFNITVQLVPVRLIALRSSGYPLPNLTKPNLM